jgi:hypothetical protein
MKNLLIKSLLPVVWILTLFFIHMQVYAQNSVDNGDLTVQLEAAISSGHSEMDAMNHFPRQEAVSHRVKGGDADANNEIIENKTQKEPMKTQKESMVYKFYKEKTKPEAFQANSNKLVEEFKKIYDKNDVEFIGVWINAENPHEQFYMTGFKDDAHYQEFLEEVKTDPEYREMSDKINEHRESIESVTLKPASDLDIETISPDDHQLYKMYTEKTKTPVGQANSNKFVDEFKKIYDKNDVEVVGVWINADDPHEQYFMTGYKDEAHYKEFLEKANANPEYQEMTEDINEDRESIEVLTLIPAEDQ